MSKQEEEYYATSNKEEIGVVAGFVQMGKDRQPMEETFTPVAVTRYELTPFEDLIAAETFFMPPFENARVYRWLAGELRRMADDLENQAQERR